MVKPVADAAEPEVVLAGRTWRIDPNTLREVIDEAEAAELRGIRELLTRKLNDVKDNPAKARLLSLRAVVSRTLGELESAFADGRLALAHAEATGQLRRIAIVQARMARILQWRGEYAEADRLYTLANSPDLPDRLRASIHQHAGRCAYEQDRLMEACNHFEQALSLRGDDPETVAETELVMEAVFRRIEAHGFGPYPRTREELLGRPVAPTPFFDEGTKTWGYIDSTGEYVIPPKYVEARPFAEGVAWACQPNRPGWELIDTAGDVLVPAERGCRGVTDFSDGYAWVSRNGKTGWVALNKSGAVAVGTGFENVRPFHRGLAAVCQGNRWGGVDASGRVVLPFRYDGFATAMHDGRFVEGYSDEGLAVVVFNRLKGIVDRNGRVVVPPEHQMVVIHPVAFLITGPDGRWGALDRRGGPMLAPEHPSRTAVAEEIDRLLVDTHPVL